MTPRWPAAGIAMVLAVAAGCSRATPPPQPAKVESSCQIVLAANTGGDSEIERLQEELRRNTRSARALEQLGHRFIAKARLSNDAGFYTLAEQTASCLARVQPTDLSGLLLRGHALHQMHRFAEAEAIARRLVASREFVLDFGLLGDVLMEQGRLEEAAKAYQKMIDLKPFYQSYTRAAHLRWLKGDLDGAIEMMQTAVKASSPRDRESVAWAYSRLAMYELQRGRLNDAGRMVETALQFVPDYASALLTRGRIELVRRRHADAAATLSRAAELNPLPEYHWAYADALRASNRASEAASIEAKLIENGEADDPRTLALYLATRRQDPLKAVHLARLEMDKRTDVFTLDALAWALAANGETREASTLIARALAEGTQDGRLYLHAAAIAAADGRDGEAARWARKARSLRFTLLPSELGMLEGGVVFPSRPRG